MENRSDIPELPNNQASGEPSESNYVLVEKCTCMHKSSTPQALYAQYNNGHTMPPSCPFHTAASSANQLEQSHDDTVVSERHQTCLAEIVMHADRHLNVYQDSYQLQAPNAGIEADIASVVQTFSQEANPPDRELCQGVSDLRMDSSMSYDGAALSAAAQSVNNQAEQAPNWDVLTGVGTWA
jgi:hypothetical protein